MDTDQNLRTTAAKGLRGWLAMFSTRPRFLALAAFLFAGDLKANPRLEWVPVDLTLLAGLVLSVVILVRLLRGWRAPSFRPLTLVVIWFVTFIPGVFQAVDSDYGLQKIYTIFTLTLLAALAPIFLVDKEEDLPKLMNAMAYFCLLIAGEGLLVVLSPVNNAARLNVFGAGTISLGRASGLLFVYSVLLLLQDAHLPVLTFGLMTLAGVIALFAGSRGPIVAALAVLTLLMVFGRQSLGLAKIKLAVAGALFLLVLSYSLSLAPEGSLQRVESFAHGQYGDSEQYRVQAMQSSWLYIPNAPLGLGWGGFGTHVNPLNGLGRQYAHNLLVETTIESGWICGAYTLVILVLAVVAAWSRTMLVGGRVIFLGLLFYIINAMVSGDINDNRPLFMFVTAALMLLDFKMVRHG